METAIDKGLPHEVPPEVRYALGNNAFIFSGFKACHSLREVGLALTSEKGDIKPFSDFRKDVEKINRKYNQNYLYAEYNHAVGASLMAARWKEFEKDKDRYLLQYRTAADSKVRPDHARLHNITLPVDDPFWEKYLPPNSWNCRCTTVQVRKGKEQESDPKEALKLGEEATAKPKQAIFRFNPGKQLKLFPPKHPYFKTPKNEKQCIEEVVRKEERKYRIKKLYEWANEHLPETVVGKFKAKRFEIETPEENVKTIINKNFYTEIVSKYQNDKLFLLKLEYAKHAHKLYPKSKFIRVEKAIDHPDSVFRVYEIQDNSYLLEFKVKCNKDGRFLYIMRVYEK